ncbi:MAG: laccase domain-containing protein, partial [Bacillota bacterium]
MMEYRIIEHGDSRYITVPQLEVMGLKVIFTTNSMDMGRKTAKSIDILEESFREVFSVIGLEPSENFFMDQIHSDVVIDIKSLSQGEPHRLGRLLGEGDAMVTRIKGIALSTTFADCVPVVL